MSEITLLEALSGPGSFLAVEWYRDDCFFIWRNGFLDTNVILSEEEMAIVEKWPITILVIRERCHYWNLFRKSIVVLSYATAEAIPDVCRALAINASEAKSINVIQPLNDTVNKDASGNCILKVEDVQPLCQTLMDHHCRQLPLKEISVPIPLKYVNDLTRFYPDLIHIDILVELWRTEHYRETWEEDLRRQNRLPVLSGSQIANKWRGYRSGMRWTEAMKKHNQNHYPQASFYPPPGRNVRSGVFANWR